MNNKIIKQLLEKKHLSKQEFYDYLNNRIQILDVRSENIIIGICQNNIYDGYIGKNVKVKCNTNLLELDNINMTNAYMQFDGDDRIFELLYNSIQEIEILNILMLLPNILSLTIMDSLLLNNNMQVRSNIYDLNAKNGKITKYSEIREKLLCMCLEKATLFHNVCKILGLDSKILFGTLNKDGVLESHAYNIVKCDDNIFLIDLANSIGRSKQTKDISMLFPIAKLTLEEYNKLLSGEKLSVDFSFLSNSLWNTENESTNFVYGVGITQEEKMKLLEQNIENNQNIVLDFLSQKKNYSK